MRFLFWRFYRWIDLGKYVYGKLKMASYIGKIVKEKANLLDKPMIDKDFDVFVYENNADTYGNVYSKATYFHYNGRYIIFNANREYNRE